MQKRRLAANAREKRRMDKLRQAWAIMDKMLHPDGVTYRLTKCETLQTAQCYIRVLCNLLKCGSNFGELFQAKLCEI